MKLLHHQEYTFEQKVSQFYQKTVLQPHSYYFLKLLLLEADYLDYYYHF